MSDPIPQNPPPKRSAGPWFGVAGCGISFTLTLLGAVVGGWIGWATSPPPPAQRANDYSGLNELVETVVHLAVGLVGGAIVGLVAGVAITAILWRRKRVAPFPRICGTVPNSRERKRFWRGWRDWRG